MSNTVGSSIQQRGCFPRNLFLIEAICHFECKMYSLESSISEGTRELRRLVTGYKAFCPQVASFKSDHVTIDQKKSFQADRCLVAYIEVTLSD